MKPGDPVRKRGDEKVCRVGRLGHGNSSSSGYRTCDDRFLWIWADHHNTAGATHRQDGTAYPLCKVCWPDGMPQVAEDAIHG